MDVDEDDYSLLSLFDTTPAAFPWPAPVVRAIEQRRAALADVLIFDILLSLGGVKHPDALYPPRDPALLQRLLAAIDASAYDALKKDGLVYFLLKAHRDGREADYAAARCLPPQFVALADAYWCLDAGENVARAVSLLADARLNRDYTSKILQALSLDPAAHSLILRYVRTAKPLLTEPDDIDAYTIALAESSLLEAWRYQRTYPDGSATKERLVRNIFTWCLTPKPRPKPLTQLLAYPLTPHETALLHAYALRPPRTLPPGAAPAIQDLAFLRLVQAGQHAAAVQLDRQLTAAGARSRDRRQTAEELVSVMPPAEKQLLEAELEAVGSGAGVSGGESAGALTNGVVGSSTAAGDLSMSWESVHSPKNPALILPPQTQTQVAKQSPQKPAQALPLTPGSHQKENINTNTTGISSPLPLPVALPPSPALFDPALPPIPQRSGAPRFGGSPAVSASASGSAASTSFTAVREMFDQMARQAPRPSAPLFPVGGSPSASAGRNASANANGGGAQSASVSAGPVSGLGPASASATPRKRGRVGASTGAGGAGVGAGGEASLFETAGSANRTPNAFFRPPPTPTPSSHSSSHSASAARAGTKRPLDAMLSPQNASVGASASARRRRDAPGSGSGGPRAGREGASMSMSISAPGTRRGLLANLEEAVEEEQGERDVEMGESGPDGEGEGGVDVEVDVHGDADVDAEGEAEDASEGEGDLTFPHIDVDAAIQPRRDPNPLSEDEDVDVAIEEDVHVESEAEVPEEQEQAREEDDAAGNVLSYSLFAPREADAPRALSRGSGSGRAAEKGKGKGKMQTGTRESTSPPGAFDAPGEESERERAHDRRPHEAHAEEHEEEEYKPRRDAMRVEELTTAAPTRKSTRTPGRPRTSRLARAQPASAHDTREEREPQRRQPARLTRTRSAQNEARLMRSIPGAFLDEVDEHEREEHEQERVQEREREEDVVPPLPSTRLRRTASTRSDKEKEKEKAKDRTRTRAEAKTPSRARATRDRDTAAATASTTRTRRSTRLAESESSDEPSGPARSRRSTRSGGSGVGAERERAGKEPKTPGRATRASTRSVRR
ncbi:hypothetical protein EIP86_000638 [Pleurotus ostreatoroseus]|nr:hypothetical protein EIP86_000638 [Pleurotus ostreatoroseus]